MRVSFVFARVWLLRAECRARGSLGPLPKAQILSPYLYSATQGPLGQEKVAFVIFFSGVLELLQRVLSEDARGQGQLGAVRGDG